MSAPPRSLLAILLVAFVAACQASPEPTIAVRTMTVTLPLPVADKAVLDAAAEVFAKRLTGIGITNFTTSIGATMTFTLTVPLTFDARLVDAVLRREVAFELVPWPAGEHPPNPGDRVPATLQPLVDARDFKSAVVTSDSTGGPALKITLTAAGKAAVATYTTDHVMGYMPLVLDGAVLAAPTILSPLTGGEFVISGPDPFPIPLVAIVAIINAGPLPAAWTRQP